MFDIGFSELLVIAVVALLVLGPERLPKAARFAGLWVRRARSQWNSVKSEFERELADEDLKRSLRDTQEALRQAHASLRDAGSHLERDLHEARDTLMRGPEPSAVPALVAAADDRQAPDPAHAPADTGEDPAPYVEDEDVLESSLHIPFDEPLPDAFDDTDDEHAARGPDDDRDDSRHVPQR
jgi:sec-independent protein translocase protein TatB